MRIPILCFLAVLFVAPIAFALSSTGEQVTVITASGSNHVFNVEMAITPEEHARGLMYRKYMPEDSGMLFIFPKKTMQSFWMRNTLIPLDMLFLDGDGKILHIHHDAQPHDETSVSSIYPVKGVLEINGGLSHEYGIAIGDRVRHKVFIAAP